MRTITLIRNPISGRRGSERGVARFVARVTDRGCQVEVRETERPGHATELAREASEAGADVVVAAGGDGTANEVACGLLAVPATETALALLPSGTSNLVARHLAIPREPIGAAEVVLSGEPVLLDVGEANGRPFLACAGIGWDAEVVARYSARRTGNRGLLGYLGPIVGATRNWKRVEIHVRAADGTEITGTMALILNMRPYASYFRPSPGASADDGLLDVVVLTRGSPGDIARWMLRGLRGTLIGDRNARLLRTNRVEIASESPVAYQLDGDVGACTPVAMLVRPRALRVLRPAGAEERP